TEHHHSYSTKLGIGFVLYMLLADLTVDYCSVTHRLNLTQSPHSRSQPDPVTTYQISTQSPHIRSQPAPVTTYQISTQSPHSRSQPDPVTTAYLNLTQSPHRRSDRT